jgi:hypothetical protein
METTMERVLLPGVPIDLIRQAYTSAPGREIETGKFESPESFAALVASTFGLFLNQPDSLARVGLASFLGAFRGQAASGMRQVSRADCQHLTLIPSFFLG